MMNSGGYSPSSFFSEEVSFSNEKQVGVRKMDYINGYLGLKPDGTLRTEGVGPSPLEARVLLETQMTNGFARPDNHLNHGRKINSSLGKHLIGAERAVSRSLPNAVDNDIGARNNSNKDSATFLLDGDKVTFMGAQHENGLFSSSLSDIFSQNSKQSSNAAYATSAAANGVVGSHYEEVEAFESLEELEAKTIGNLLPDDDDLLSGVTDGLGNIIRAGNGEESEDLDLFSSVGGLELGEEAFSLRNSKFSDFNSNDQLARSASSNGAEPTSRTLFVKNINSNVEDSELRMLFEKYGDVCTLYTVLKQKGFIMITYYDIRAACNAVKDLQNKLDIHFSTPKESALKKDINQGTLVFKIDPSVSDDELREIFGVYGEINEIRDAPHLSHHKFIEFYDVRAAEAALRALNTSNFAGKQIKLEPGWPGVSKRLLQPFSPEHEQEKSSPQMQLCSASNNLAAGFSGSLSYGDSAPGTNNGTMFGRLSTNGGHRNPTPDILLRPTVPSSLSNGLPSRSLVDPGNQSGVTELSHLRNHLKFELRGASNLHPHSLPEYHDGLANGLPFGSSNNIATNMSPRLPQMIDSPQFQRVNSNGPAVGLTEVFGSSGNGSCPPGRHYMWTNSHQPQPQGIMWPNSPSFANGMAAAQPQQLHAVPRAPSHMLNAMLNDHHVGSAPSVNPSMWDRRPAYVGESPDAALFHPGSLGNMRISGGSPHPLEFVPHSMFSSTGGSYTDMTIPSKNIGLHPHPHNPRPVIFPARGQMHPMMSSLDSPNERTRNRRNEGSSSQSDNKKQFELDIDRILRGEDKRTTLMIKNIPNKYTSKMLLAAIDERHKGTYDFIYLPIDFKNKCNVGYAFINMTDPSLIVPFYETFNGKKWEKFNSEKVASLAYARIQGRAALIAHFQNSSLMNEDKRCRPILFHTDGPNAGDQVPFPMGTNIRPRAGKTRANTSEENTNQIIPQDFPSGEDYSYGDSSSGSGKDSD